MTGSGDEGRPGDAAELVSGLVWVRDFLLGFCFGLLVGTEEESMRDALDAWLFSSSWVKDGELDISY